jgi:hypothetical protein
MQTNPPTWQDGLGRALMGLACLGALAAFVQGVGVARSAPPEFTWVETWRTTGFLVFAGMFGLLTVRPRLSAGVWELAFFHKTAMVGASLFLHGEHGSGSAGAVDAALVALLVLSYLLTRGWRAWQAREVV